MMQVARAKRASALVTCAKVFSEIVALVSSVSLAEVSGDQPSQAHFTRLLYRAFALYF
jgi:hypothetical protein